jgi:SAM-dependent methyltransferase
MTIDRDADASRLAAESLSQGDPTGWFERLYAEAAAGAAIVPWDQDEPNPLLAEWTARHAPDGAGRRALVVGCGYGRDAEHLAALGFRTTAFDISETAIRGARERFPESTVDYRAADLLDPPADWAGTFDLVVESITVQSMPLSVRAAAIAGVRRMVAPGGQLLVISGIRAEGERVDGPPWPLTRAELDSFATDGLHAVQVEEAPDVRRWRALFQRG